MIKVLGILGGGQLGQMTAQAARKLGIKTHVFTPENQAPAVLAADSVTVAQFDNHAALRRFADKVDAITYEFENIPADAVDIVAAMKPVFPNADALRATQNRIREKTLCADLGIPTAPWREIVDMDSARRALSDLGRLVIKTAEMGYDGKGQWKVSSDDGLAAIPFAHNSQALIAEGFVDFDFEISVIAARGITGEVKCFPPVRNEHRNHILWQTHAPAELSLAVAARAEDYARRLIEKLEIVGLLAVEMFVVGDDILVNEMAPRPHNSGHWTIEGCACSQFEQLVRALLGLPLGDVTPRGKFVMQNLIGDEIKDAPRMVAEMGGVFHDYGKLDIRTGRKMGHVTWEVRS